ncbi:MAG: hypothetical protein ACTHMO_03885 [Rhodanobacteraceae bacterium]
MKKLEAAGFTRAQIALATGRTRQGVGHWARDRNAPSASDISVLIKLGESKGVTFLAADFLPERSAA